MHRRQPIIIQDVKDVVKDVADHMKVQMAPINIEQCCQEGSNFVLLQEVVTLNRSFNEIKPYGKSRCNKNVRVLASFMVELIRIIPNIK